MPNDPKYVQLTNRLSQGIVADIGGSGWAISGLDVKEFPTTDAAARFVRAELRSGKLEPVGKAEFDEVQEAHKNATKAANHQEAQVVRAAQREHLALRESRGLDDSEGDLEDLEDLQNERLSEQDDDSDDPEEQVTRSNPLRDTGSKSKGSKKSKSKKAKDEEPAS